MRDMLAALDAPTMVLMVVVLFMALCLVLTYTYACRRTYPGFGAMSLAQVAWTAGIFLNFYRVFGETASLFLGNALMLLECVLMFHGLARYGQMADIRWRSGSNVVISAITLACLGYYLFVDFDTCRRVTVFSVFFAVMFGRIALEPYLCRRWRTYATQGALSGIFFLMAVLFGARAIVSWHSANCAPGGPDALAKLLLLLAMLFSPLLVSCILAMTSSRLEEELRTAQDALQHLAATDPLTGLPNRRHFLRLAGEAMATARGQGRGVCFIMLDLDHFKNINDTYGHKAGDMALCGVARLLQEAALEPDCAGRLGGEEFGILLPAGDLAAACAVAERLRLALAELRPGGHAITASLGVAVGQTDVDALLARADEGLYAAKRAGRNRVVCQERIAPDEVAAGGANTEETVP